MLQHVVDPLPSQDLVRVSGLAQAVEEQRQEVVVVQLVDLHLVGKQQSPSLINGG